VARDAPVRSLTRGSRIARLGATCSEKVFFMSESLCSAMRLRCMELDVTSADFFSYLALRTFLVVETMSHRARARRP
jgi:hypothetical protein